MYTFTVTLQHLWTPLIHYHWQFLVYNYNRYARPLLILPLSYSVIFLSSSLFLTCVSNVSLTLVFFSSTLCSQSFKSVASFSKASIWWPGCWWGEHFDFSAPSRGPHIVAALSSHSLVMYHALFSVTSVTLRVVNSVLVPWGVPASTSLWFGAESAWITPFSPCLSVLIVLIWVLCGWSLAFHNARCYTPTITMTSWWHNNGHVAMITFEALHCLISTWQLHHDIGWSVSVKCDHSQFSPSYDNIYCMSCDRGHVI